MSALAQDAMLGSTNLPTQIVDAFQQLVQDLSNVLGPSSGLDSADVDPLDLQKLMEGYTSTEAEWQKYAWGDPCRTYTRNLVDKGNGKSNLVGSNKLCHIHVLGLPIDSAFSLFWYGRRGEEAQSMTTQMHIVL